MERRRKGKEKDRRSEEGRKPERERGRREKGRTRWMSCDTRYKEKMPYIIQMFCLRKTKH